MTIKITITRKKPNIEARSLKPGQFFRFVGDERVCIVMQVLEIGVDFRFIESNTPKVCGPAALVVPLRLTGATFEEK